jgi:hypothetical protein
VNREGYKLLRRLLERVTTTPDPQPEPRYFTRRTQHRTYQRRNYGMPRCR